MRGAATAKPIALAANVTTATAPTREAPAGPDRVEGGGGQGEADRARSERHDRHGGENPPSQAVRRTPLEQTVAADFARRVEQHRQQHRGEHQNERRRYRYESVSGTDSKRAKRDRARLAGRSEPPSEPGTRERAHRRDGVQDAVADSAHREKSDERKIGDECHVEPGAHDRPRDEEP